MRKRGFEMFKWLKDLLQKKEEPEGINLDEYIIKCPKCGSTNIGYFTGLVNFVEAMRGGSAHYKQTATCLNCHFQVESEIDDNDNNYLKQMELIKKSP